MKKVLWTLFGLLMTTAVIAGPQLRMPQDLKLPTQAIMHHQVISGPRAALGTPNEIWNQIDGANSASARTISTFNSQPDVPRNLVITNDGSTGQTGTCSITVSGTNIYGRSISEVFSFVAQQAAQTATGKKAFKTVTSAVFAANCETGGFATTWDMGVGSKLGLNRCMNQPGSWVFSEFSGVYSSTRATVAVDTTHVESNTAQMNESLLGGSSYIDAFFVENFICF